MATKSFKIGADDTSGYKKYRKVQRRQMGIDTAVSKLTKEELEIEAGDILQINENFFDVVDVDGDTVLIADEDYVFEVSKDMLGSHINKSKKE